MGYPIQRGNSTKPLQFLLVDSGDHITGKTGVTPTVTIRKTGGAYEIPVGLVTEIANGMYEVAANPVDANTLGPLALHATATGADPRDDIFDVVDYNPALVQPYSPPTITAFGTTTAGKIIERALRMLGIVANEDTLEAGDAIPGLRTLNAMIDEWATQRLISYVIAREVFPLVSDQESYSVGLGGDIDIVRPNWIEGVAVIYHEGQTTENEVKLGYPYTPQHWRSVTSKKQTSTQPQRGFYDPTFPLGTFYPWPIFTGGGTLHMALYVPETLAGFSALHTQYAFPNGYENAITYNLAVELAPEYGVPIHPNIEKRALEAKGNIKRLNHNKSVLTFDRALTNIGGTRRAWDIRNG